MRELRIILALIYREELLMRNEFVYPEVDLTFWRLNTSNTREACPSCSDH